MHPQMFKKSNESGFLSRQADPALLPIQGNVSALPTSMRLQHIHHWSIRNCFATIPDTTMIENVIMSSHAFYFGLTVESFSMKNCGVGEDRTQDPWCEKQTC